MMTQRPTDSDKVSADHDLLIRLKENIEYFQDSVLGDIEELVGDFDGKINEIKSELCGINKRIAELEKDMIRKQSNCETNSKSVVEMERRFEDNRKSVEKLFDDYRIAVDRRVEDLRTQYKWYIGIAVTITGMVVGLVTFLITYVRP